MAKKNRKQEQPHKKKKIGLLAALFAPLDTLEDDEGLLDDASAADDGIDYDTEFDDEDDSAVDENGELIHLFDDDEVEYSEEQDYADAENLVWDDGERVVTDYDPIPAEEPASEGSSASPDKPKRGRRRQEQQPDDRDLLGGAVDMPEEINLFDDTDDQPVRRSSGRTRIFRTGSTTAARININETETIRAVDAAKRKQRAEEAERQHERYVAKKTRKKKRKDFFKRIAMNLVFGAFILISVIAAVYYTFLLSDIVVTGNDQYSAEYIVELSGLKLGKHMFFVDLDTAKSRIEADPYLQVDNINYIFPSRVRIDITERKEVAGIIGLDYNVIIDHNGYVLSMSGGTDLSSLLQVTGISMTGFQVGERIGESSDFGTASLIQLIEKLEEYELIGKIKSIDMTTPLAIVMYTRQGFKIHLGQPTDLDSKFSSLKTLLPRFEERNINTGTLYLSAKGGTVYSPQGAGAAAATSPAPDTPADGDGAPDLDATPGPDFGTDPAEPGPATPNPGVTPPPPTPTPDSVQPGGGDGFQG